MVFKRRDRRPVTRIVVEAFYPKGGWGRAISYVRLRLGRLPGTPEYIARGICAGVFTTFTPFYGLHFVTAALIATVMRGSILAAILGTFFGNPLTYLPIGVISLKTGYFLLGMQRDHEAGHSLGAKFMKAGGDLWDNFLALFTGAPQNWAHLAKFYNDVFFPYMIGGIIPGIIAGVIAYFISVPLLRAYQKRRQGKMRAKFEALKKAPRQGADKGLGVD